MKLKILDNSFSICKVKDIKNINLDEKIIFVGKTDEEISVVCDDNSVPTDYTDIDKKWKCIKIVGVLDFSLIGILSKISTILANEKIGIFVVSTYNTDYILVKEENIDSAKKALENNGYDFV